MANDSDSGARRERLELSCSKCLMDQVLRRSWICLINKIKEGLLFEHVPLTSLVALRSKPDLDPWRDQGSMVLDDPDPDALIIIFDV